jgi:hypothetical protein
MAPDETTPTSRLSRTARIGGLVAGQSARVAGGRAVDRVRSDDAKARASASAPPRSSSRSSCSSAR